MDKDNADYLIRGNFIGYMFTSVLIGPLADNYSKKKIFLLALLLYTVSGIFCFFSDSFTALVFGRFLQGIFEATMYVVAWVIFFSSFTAIQSSKLTGIIKGSSKVLLNLLPLLAVWFSAVYNWRLVLLILPILSLISFVIAASILKEKKVVKKKKIKLKEMFKKYLTLLKNFEFLTYVFIYSVSTAVYVVFFSNASIVFVGSQLTIEEFSYLRTTYSTLYIMSSFLSAYLISKKGVDYTKNLGFIIFLIGTFGLFTISVLNENNIHLIFMFIFISAIGIGLMVGFLLKAVSLFPDDKGAVISVTALSAGFLSLRGIFWTQIFFNDSIIPTSSIIFFASLVAITFFSIVCYKKFKEKL